MRKPGCALILAVAALTAARCDRADDSNHTITLTVRRAAQGRPAVTPPPANATSFDCFFVDVRGTGIAASPLFAHTRLGSACLGLGATSPGFLVSPGTSTTIPVTARGGTARKARVFAVKRLTATACSDQPVASILTDASLPQVYALGESPEFDLTEAKTVDVPFQYPTPPFDKDLTYGCDLPIPQAQIHLVKGAANPGGNLWGDPLAFPLSLSTLTWLGVGMSPYFTGSTAFTPLSLFQSRIDIVVELAQIPDPTGFRGFTVRVDGPVGRSAKTGPSFPCEELASTSTESSGELRIYDKVSNTWISVGPPTNAVVDASFSWGSDSSPFIQTENLGAGDRSVIHLSYRSTLPAGGSDCSSVKLSTTPTVRLTNQVGSNRSARDPHLALE